MELRIKKAGKTRRPIKIGLSGASGSGKTYSALLLASGLAEFEKICVIDTERSAGLYSVLGDYSVLELAAPFSHTSLLTAISAVKDAGFQVCIIDSLSHFWSGTGGLLELADELAQKKYRGNTFQAWNEISPLWRKIQECIINTEMHFIVCMRAKSDYAIETGGGKTIIKKVGLKEDVRDGFEFELDCSFNLTQEHLAYVSKDRTSMFSEAFLPTSEIGLMLAKWAETGQVDTKNDVSELRARFISLLEETKGINDKYEAMNKSVYSLTPDRLTQGIEFLTKLKNN